MALDDKHPEYSRHLGEWIQMEDTYAGERAVKMKRLEYLPATEAMVQDGMTTPSSPGWKDYNAYLMRAVFHDVVRDAVKAMVGMMNMKPATIHLTPKLGDLVKKATIQGESLQMLLRRINEAQLVKGCCGILVDAPTGADANKALPYLSFYAAENIINWDEGIETEGQNKLDLVVLNESGPTRKGFTWVDERKFRVLTRGTPESLNSAEMRPAPDDPYVVCVKTNDLSTPVAANFIQPQIAGRELDDIPFIFIGSTDLVPKPGVPPLLGLSNLALAIYRGEADYRQTLFMQGQNTLVVIGASASDSDTQLRTGNKGIIDLRIGGDAKYIGVSAAGLGEMRQSLMNDKNNAAVMGSSFMDPGQTTGDSGEALRIRVAAKTTTVSDVARAAGAGLERALKFCAQWLDEDQDQIKVETMTDFADTTVAGAALLAFMQAKQLGLPLSLKSLHRMMKLNDMTEMDFEDENIQIEEEAVSLIGQMVSLQNISTAANAMLEGADPAVEAGGEPAAVPPEETVPPAGTAPPIPKNSNVPIKPHVRGSPVPLKRKVGPKGASAK